MSRHSLASIAAHSYQNKCKHVSSGMCHGKRVNPISKEHPYKAI